MIPGLNLAFEYNGEYWHDGDGSYERDKTIKASAAGITLIHVWESAWQKSRSVQEQIVLNHIKS